MIKQASTPGSSFISRGRCDIVTGAKILGGRELAPPRRKWKVGIVFRLRWKDNLLFFSLNKGIIFALDGKTNFI